MAADSRNESSGFGGKFGSMLGLSGFLGLVLMLVGIAVVAVADPVVAAGLAVFVVGIALVVKALLGNMLSMFGMGGMF
ncbi:DUF7470 family protein [Haloarchaeobius sp. TZWWS8]|uniref:DUF7470 family protein n=1 Tax=Haloarchaeobius sp. TZWWS8 TaxID=3446121 RepID=UPI003EBD9FC9